MIALTVTRFARGITLRLGAIEIPSTTRAYNATAVVGLKQSIAAIGLQSAPTCIERDGRYVLVAGRHRLEALRLLGVDSVMCRLVDFSDLEARMWTISENLHRAELGEVQRSQQMAEYVKLSNEKREADLQTGQLAQNESRRDDGRGHRHEGGNSQAARDLGVTREEVRRAQTIASLPEATLAAAEDFDLDDNQSALLAAARVEEPEEQIAVLKEIAGRGKVSAPRDPDAKPLHNLVNLSAGKFATSGSSGLTPN